MRNTRSWDLDGPSLSRIAAALAAPVADQPAAEMLARPARPMLQCRWEIKAVAPVSKAHLAAIERQREYEAKEADRAARNAQGGA
jgi:hypothetical protein